MDSLFDFVVIMTMTWTMTMTRMLIWILKMDHFDVRLSKRRNLPSSGNASKHLQYNHSSQKQLHGIRLDAKLDLR